MKLLLFLSHSGVASRRKAFECIVRGHVKVNGKAQLEPSTEINPYRDKVLCMGQPVEATRFDYVLLNKPRGYVTTCESQFQQRTVMDLLPRELKHVRPVGRLDKDTEGLLLFTNDGELANRLAHPRYDVDKTYLARVRWFFKHDSIRRLEQGILIDGEKTAPAKVKILQSGEKESDLEITIHEGRKHQVRLMLSSVGNPVVHLRRLRQGPLELGTLRSAAWRRLTEDEIRDIKAIRPLPPPVREEAPEPRGRGMIRKGPSSPGGRRSPGSTWRPGSRQGMQRRQSGGHQGGR
jgi:23S rRNA pseudouridine2605 synthase